METQVLPINNCLLRHCDSTESDAERPEFRCNTRGLQKVPETQSSPLITIQETGLPPVAVHME